MHFFVNKKYLFFVIVILTPLLVNANFQVGQCSNNGYTIATINGINTTKSQAEDNMKGLQAIYGNYLNQKKIDYEYLYNPTHTLGIGDVFDTIDQGSFGKADDIDLLNIQNDASNEIKTQKVLLVGHSQGNFYVNNLYNRIVGTSIPQQSIGAYAVATPAAYIAGVTRGTENTDNYVTSDNDQVINKYAAMAMYSLPSNVHISVHNSDDSNGHDFLKIYMNYLPNTIVAGITKSLSKLESNSLQDPEKPCIVAPQFALLDKIQNNTLAVTDFALNVTVGVPVKVGIALVNKVSQFANSLFTPSSNLARNTKASALDAVTPVSDAPVAAPVSAPRTPIVVVPPVVPNTPVVTTAPKEKIPDSVPPTPVVDIPAVPVPEITQPVAPVITPVVTPPVSFGGGGGGGSAPVGRGQGPTDTIPPVITLAGSTPMTIPLHSTYTDLGATATDNFDGTVAVSTSGTVDTTTSGVYILTYTARDAHNNTATTTRTVTVDTLVGPVITLLGTNPLVLTRGDAFTDPGATALDAVDGARPVTTTGTVDTAHGGVYTLTYSSTDASGNTTQAVRTVKVISTEKAITAFSFALAPDPTISCTITESSHIVNCLIKQISLTHAGLTVATLVPHIILSPSATISPASDNAHDFTNPVIYTVTAGDGTTQEYTVKVITTHFSGTQYPGQLGSQGIISPQLDADTIGQMCGVFNDPYDSSWGASQFKTSPITNFVWGTMSMPDPTHSGNWYIGCMGSGTFADPQWYIPFHMTGAIIDRIGF